MSAEPGPLGRRHKTKINDYTERLTNPDGTFKGRDQRREEDRQRRMAKMRVEQEIARRVQKPVSHDQTVISVEQQRLALLREKLDTAQTKTERESLRRRIKILEGDVEKREATADDQARIERRKADPLVKIAMETADRLERSWQHIYPQADEGDVQTAIAIGKNTDLEPSEVHREFFGVLERIEAASFAAESAKQTAAKEAATLANLQSARADVAALKAEQRLAETRSQLGDSHEQ